MYCCNGRVQSLASMKRTVENIRDPLFRFFEREVNAGIQMLADVRRDIEDAIQICLGEKKQTNHHRILLAALAKSQLCSPLAFCPSVVY